MYDEVSKILQLSVYFGRIMKYPEASHQRL